MAKSWPENGKKNTKEISKEKTGHKWFSSWKQTKVFSQKSFCKLKKRQTHIFRGEFLFPPHWALINPPLDIRCSQPKESLFMTARSAFSRLKKVSLTSYIQSFEAGTVRNTLLNRSSDQQDIPIHHQVTHVGRVLTKTRGNSISRPNQPIAVEYPYNYNTFQHLVQCVITMPLLYLCC